MTMSPDTSGLISQFENFKAYGYGQFCNDNIVGYSTVVVENAQIPTEQLALAVAEYMRRGEQEPILIKGGSVVFPDQRVIIALQQLSPKGVDRYDTKQHLLRIAAQI